MVKDLATNLYAGARLCFMLPVNRGNFRTSLDQAFALLVLGSATILLIEFASTEGHWFPSADRVGFYALAILVGLVGCFAATRLLGNAEGLSAIAVLLLAGAFWMAPVFGPIFVLAGPETLAPGRLAGTIVGILLVLWFLGIAMRAFHLITGGSFLRAAVAASILVVFTALPKLVLTPADIWMPAPAKLPPSWTQENLYYGQFGMMERAVEWLGKHRPGVPDLFFVGFGADAREPVFVNEMRSVAQLFETRFDAKDRSIVMINNRSTVRRAPLANAHNLGRALSEIGKRMDTEEDVLFLYLSTPALADGEITPNFAPLSFVPLHPRNIQRMLDDANIKYSVIILSSCAADGFIKHLRGPNTLVISAAGDGQRARGCWGNAPFTDFGKAFFDEALRNDFSIPDAFDRARTLIAERNKSALRAASAPAIYVGDAMTAKLSELSRQLKTAHAATTVAPAITAPARVRQPKSRTP